MPIAATDIWHQAKRILLPWQGGASQLFVLDIPTQHYGAVLDAFAQFVDGPTIVTMDSYSGEPRPFDAATREVLLSRKSGCHQLAGLHAGREHVSMFLEPHPPSFDAEFVFWSDQLFPQPDDEAACLSTLKPYVALAESIRSLSPLCECVISSSEAGNPRRDREKPWTVWW